MRISDWSSDVCSSDLARADKSLEATVLPEQVGEFVCRRIGPAHRIDRAAHAIVEPQHAAGTAAGIDGDVANGAAAMIGMRIQIVGRHVASIWKIPLRSIMCAHFSWQRNLDRKSKRLNSSH